MTLPPTPWTVDEECFSIRDANGVQIVTPTENIVLRKLVVLRRIVACVNACENFHTSGLEKIGRDGSPLEFALRASLNEKRKTSGGDDDFLRSLGVRPDGAK